MSSSPAPLTSVPKPPIASSVSSFDATSIHYDLYPGTSRTAILVVPGFWRERRHPAMVALARLLNDRGYTAAVLDSRGHGESGGTFGFNLNEHYDVAAVANDILARYPIESITLIGFSYGGAIAISTAARHKLPLASILLISPVADFSMLLPRINPFTMHRHIAFSQALRKPRFEWRMRRTPKLRALDDVRDVHVPISFVHVKNDWLVGHTHSVALYESASEPKELHVIDIPGNYHADRIFSVARDRVEPMVLEFLERYSR
jgi:pimeloyl-ACP methyl ester carboxylesterase